MVARYHFTWAGITRMQFGTIQGLQPTGSQLTSLINTVEMYAVNEELYAQRESLPLLATPQGCHLGPSCQQYPTAETKVARG